VILTADHGSIRPQGEGYLGRNGVHLAVQNRTVVGLYRETNGALRIARVLYLSVRGPFYEPAYLFSGTFQIRGTVYVKHVLVSAIDPSRNA